MVRDKKTWALYMRSWRLKNPEQYRAYKKQQNVKWRKEHKEEVLASTRAQRLRWPEKYKARTKVSNAVRDGRLFKKPCEVCGELRVQAHHEDYSKPLEVRWFCQLHHRSEEMGEYVYKPRGA